MALEWNPADPAHQRMLIDLAETIDTIAGRLRAQHDALRDLHQRAWRNNPPTPLASMKAALLAAAAELTQARTRLDLEMRPLRPLLQEMTALRAAQQRNAPLPGTPMWNHKRGAR